jgi:nucleotide-binding universal stress UspA family protein
VERDVLDKQRQVQAAIVVDEPAAALLAPPVSATGPLLVAVGTRGLGPVTRFLLGSVSTKVLRAGHSPLLIVPRRAAPAQTSTRAA